MPWGITGVSIVLKAFTTYQPQGTVLYAENTNPQPQHTPLLTFHLYVRIPSLLCPSLQKLCFFLTQVDHNKVRAYRFNAGNSSYRVNPTQEKVLWWRLVLPWLNPLVTGYCIEGLCRSGWLLLSPRHCGLVRLSGSVVKLFVKLSASISFVSFSALNERKVDISGSASFQFIWDSYIPYFSEQDRRG